MFCRLTLRVCRTLTPYQKERMLDLPKPLRKRAALAAYRAARRSAIYGVALDSEGGAKGESIMKGYLRRQSPETFAYRVDVPRGQDGLREQKFFTISARTKAAAEVKAAQLLIELERGGPVDAAATMVAIYLERWLWSIKSTV
jgi:hypothetical protein